MKKHNSNDNPWRAAGLVSAITAELILCIVLGYWGGSWLGDRLDEMKYVAIGTLVGLFVGIICVILSIRVYAKDSK